MAILRAIIVVCILVGAGLGAGGVWELHQQDTGMKVVVTVGECHTVTGGSTHATTECTGSWVQGGSLLGNGHVVVGSINGASSGDVGKKIDARVHGDTAFIRTLRLPIVLFVVGGGIMLFGLWFLWAMLTGRADGSRKSTAAATATAS